MKPHLSSIQHFLSNEFTSPIRDPLWGHIYISRELMEIIQTSEFQQLSRIKQLGPSYLVYPGATHTRLNHSLGVFHIAFRILERFLRSPHAFPISLEGAKSFLAASLLHDLGHFPFTHSLKELPLRDHEELTGDIILHSPIHRILKERWKVDPRLCASIVDRTREPLNEEVEFFRKVLSGPVDPDKLDYLNRDAYFCGVPYGSQDVDYILSVLHPNQEHGFLISSDGLGVIENVLFAKYLMYRAVYWHRTVRTATGMIKKSLHRALERGTITPTELYGLDDDSFYLNFGQRQEEEFSLIRKVYHRELYSPIHTVHFSADNPIHAGLEDLSTRSIREDLIRAELADLTSLRIGDFDVILDIPENISFEAKMMVLQGEDIAEYQSSPTVFTPEVVSQFTRSLRKIRVSVAPHIKQRILDLGIQSRHLQNLGGLAGDRESTNP